MEHKVWRRVASRAQEDEEGVGWEGEPNPLTPALTPC
jgi:hypothetical protein